MNVPGPANVGGLKTDSMDLVSQARSLRRKMVFWRRTAWLALGMAGIVLIILWQRGQQHRHVCEQSLRAYFREAQRLDLAKHPPELLEEEWRRINPPGGEMISAHHYNLIVRNWHTKPVAGELLPMAVCGESHASIPRACRNVLMYDGQQVKVFWMAHASLNEIIKSAERDDTP